MSSWTILLSSDEQLDKPVHKSSRSGNNLWKLNLILISFDHFHLTCHINNFLTIYCFQNFKLLNYNLIIINYEHLINYPHSLLIKIIVCEHLISTHIVSFSIFHISNLFTCVRHVDRHIFSTMSYIYSKIVPNHFTCTWIFSRIPFAFTVQRIITRTALLWTSLLPWPCIDEAMTNVFHMLEASDLRKFMCAILLFLRLCCIISLSLPLWNMLAFSAMLEELTLPFSKYFENALE